MFLSEEYQRLSANHFLDNSKFLVFRTVKASSHILMDNFLSKFKLQTWDDRNVILIIAQTLAKSRRKLNVDSTTAVLTDFVVANHKGSLFLVASIASSTLGDRLYNPSLVLTEISTKDKQKVAALSRYLKALPTAFTIRLSGELTSDPLR